VSTVLSVFMGGLALGAHMAGKQADRLSKPLFSYGILEVLIALYALLTPLIFHWVLPLFSLIGAKFADRYLIITLWRFVISVVLLLPPTILMGATLPVLSRFCALRKPDSGRSVGLLYGINTTGAFCGVLVVGFFLLPNFGLIISIIFIAICNLLLGLLACLMGWRAESTQAMIEERPLVERQESQQGNLMILVALALTGCAAMICQVAWTRVLILVLGASVYAFTMVLSTFLAGLGIGGWSIATILRVSPSKARVVFYGLALCSAVSVCLSSATFHHLPTLFVQMFWRFDIGSHPKNMLWIQGLIATFVIFGPALSMGGLFSAAVRVVVKNPNTTGHCIGRLYSANTLGAIVGSFAAGFILIPLLGIRNTLVLAATAQCVGGMAGLISENRIKNVFSVALGAIVIIIIFVLTPPWNKLLMTNGMFTYAKCYTQINADPMNATLENEKEILFYADGLTSTVTVATNRHPLRNSLYIATNGKIDGSSSSDMPTQRLVAHLPMLCHSELEKICVIGMGTGCTAGSAALYPNVHVTVVEIEEAMVEGAKFFRDHNYAVHENPRVDIRVTDARLFLRLRPEAFDVIISEPSNPWLAGTSDLFTQQFYQIGAKALRSGGIFCQWVPIYEMSLADLLVMVRTFTSVFPHTYMATTIPNSDILLLGSRQPISINPKRVQSRMALKAIQQDLSDPRVKINDVYELLARIRMGPQEVLSLTGIGQIHTDDHPILAYTAPMNLYLDTSKRNMRFLEQHARGIDSYLADVFDSADERQAFFQKLAAAYQAFLPRSKRPEIPELLGSN